MPKFCNGQNIVRTEQESLENTVRHIGEEARMILPGIQTLFGFQLIAVFNDRFDALPIFDKELHLAATICTAIAVILVLTPAAYHRQAEPRAISTYFTSLGTVALTASMVPLALSICLELYLITNMAIEQTSMAIAVAAFALIVFFSLWFALPAYCRIRNRQQ